MRLDEEKRSMNENQIIADGTRHDLIADRFLGKGLVKTIARDTAEQIAREEKTREIDPEAYRLSEYSEEYISARYRHGKELMSGEDLIEYVEEARGMHAAEKDFSVTPSEEERACKPVLRSEATPSVRERLAMVPRAVRALPSEAVARFKAGYPTWFDGSRADTSRETRRFPFSAFAAILAVAMSLGLVVASSVLLHHGESRLNTLKLEVDAITEEIGTMESDLSAKTDLLSIRDVAVEEFGMVDEAFVRQEYVSTQKEDSIVVYEEERDSFIGLSTLLNALGIK